MSNQNLTFTAQTVQPKFNIYCSNYQTKLNFTAQTIKPKFNMLKLFHCCVVCFQACSFGARYHNNYGAGFGCHTFGRRTDHVRAVFLDMLEKHAHPPPAK